MQERKLGYLPLLLACALALSLLPLLFSAVPVHAQAGAPWKPAPPAVTVRASETVTSYVYLPLVINNFPEPVACDPILGQTYSAISVDLENSKPPSPSAGEDPGFNINLLDFQPRPHERYWLNVGGTDPAAPQFAYVYSNPHRPGISEAYQIYNGGGPDGYNPVTALGLPAAVGQVIHVPERFGPQVVIDPQVPYKALVLYASEQSITLKYGREDGLAGGYDENGHPTVGAYVAFIDGICVEPNLLALYHQMEAGGRLSLPALHGHQPVGRATGSEIRIALRDTGTWMDPRWLGDWWIHP
jgi:hypothetical protein